MELRLEFGAADFFFVFFHLMGREAGKGGGRREIEFADVFYARFFLFYLSFFRG